MTSVHRKIYLIRHGETEWTISGRHTGLTDIPLTENGKEQAQALGKFLKGHGFQKILVSPLQRAKETCVLAGLFTGHAEVDHDLVEWNYGSYEGLTTPEIRKENPHWSIFLQGAPNGESLADIGARANRVLGKIRSLNGDIAVFSSGHFLRALAARWLDLAPSFGKFLVLSPASISVLGYEKEQKVILSWNNTTY